tara:strand:- start:104 stop:475 length:372 start_codon:yes stop_codon:yes gene_type:complete
MSVTSQLEKAEEAIRQALINALAEGEDEYLSELFDTLSSVRDLRMKINNTIRFSDNTEDFYDRLNDPNYSFNLSSPYLSSLKIGKDLDLMDDLDFGAAGPVPGAASNDVISFEDYKSQEHRPD